MVGKQKGTNAYIKGLKLEGIVPLASTLLVRLSSTVEEAVCALCETFSRKIHSYYIRRLKDLPWADFSLHLYLRVRRFYCIGEKCPKQTFNERLGSEIEAYARRTSSSITNCNRWRWRWAVKLALSWR